MDYSLKTASKLACCIAAAALLATTATAHASQVRLSQGEGILATQGGDGFSGHYARLRTEVFK